VYHPVYGFCSSSSLRSGQLRKIFLAAGRPLSTSFCSCECILNRKSFDGRTELIIIFPIIIPGISILVALGFFWLGAAVAAPNITSAACGEGSASAASHGGIGDSVAPEGPVSSNFEAKFDYRGRPRELAAQEGIVAADHGRCSDIGAAVLKDGGNAVDAAVATALCQGIYNPMASGVGGGHIMLIRLPNGTSEVIDAREVAPVAASEEMFKGKPQAALVGGLAAAVPLELRGLHLAHSRHGVLPWSRLVEPAAAVAEGGFEAHPYLVSALEMANFTAYPELRDIFLINDAHTKTWRAPVVNETCCKRPQLAQLLRDVANEGPDVLYQGKYAAQFAADIQGAGGIITVEDLSTAQAVVEEPLRTHVMGVDVVGPPPPSSAATIMTALLVLGGYDLPLAGSGSLGIHRAAEAMKHAFALRMSLGDPGSGESSLVPHLKELLADMQSSEYADSLREMILDDGVLNTTMYGGKWNILKSGVMPEDHGTSHMNVVDKDRMAVALTSTVNTGFGSKVLSKSTGIILNNQMDDFSTPGQPNVYGIPPSRSNFIVPGKKPFSSMSPLVVERGGQLRMVLGASGGPRIISAVLQTLLRVLAYGEDAFSAVAGPRVHHQLVPDVLYGEAWTAGDVEFYYDNSTLHGLEARGHQVLPSAWGAVVQAVVADPDPADDNENGNSTTAAETGMLRAVSDPRKDGAPSACTLT
jgi:gamma-glutamyltranspeptidase / glutathione hydrolase / leukotriene-C4 hydrolase